MTASGLLGVEKLEERARELAGLQAGARRRASAAPGEHLRRLDANVLAPARGLPPARRGRARGPAHLARRRVAARQLPPDRGRGAQRPARPAARATTASCPSSRRASSPAWRASTRWRCELIAHSDAPARRRAPDALPRRLPDRRAADHRRAVGLAEHAEAGAASRTCAQPDGRHRSARAARARPRRRCSHARRPETGPRPPLPAAARTAPFVVQLLQRMREYGAARRALRAAARGARCAARGPTVEDVVRAEHQRQATRAGLGRQRDHQPAAVRDARLEPLRRAREPGRAGPAARSRRRLRADGLPEPRPLPPGGRGAGRAHGRGAGARRRCARRERARRRPSASPATTARPTSATT